MTRSIPTPYAVQRFPFQPGATNDYGNPVDGWADPVGVLVHGWAPPSADEVPFEQGRSAVVRDLDLYAPRIVECGPKDHWVIPGAASGLCSEHDLPCFAQEGWAQDYSTGPFVFDAGLRVQLKRVEG